MERMRKRRDFLNAAKGLRIGTPAFLMQSLATGADKPARIGLTVTKKLGGSPLRNRIRRRLREALRLEAEGAPSGRDLVLVARPAAAFAGFIEIRADIRRAFEKSSAHTKA